MQHIYLIDGEMLKDGMKAGFANLIKYKEHINYLNVFPVPDGDTGTNMFLTVSSAVKEMESVDSDEVGPLVQAMAKGALMGARGNSGVILSQLFRGFAGQLKNNKVIDYKDFTNASEKAVKMAYKAVLKPVEGTILTVAKAVAQGIKDASYSTKEIPTLLNKGITAGEKALEKTPEMLPVLAKAGVVDAGGKGLLVILQGIANYLDGKDIEDIKLEIINEPATNLAVEDIGDYIYCTECVIKGQKLDEKEVLEEIKSLGDSTIVVGDNNLLKVHIHSNNPGKILEIGLKYGSLHDLKIENMMDQSRQLTNHGNIDDETKEIGVVAVVAGEGLKKILESMGADIVIEGGQTMNPSTEDLLSAINGINASNILILPNNSNIIMAAQQAAELTEKAVMVVPTKNFPQGMSAMLGYDSGEDLETNYNNMMEHFKNILTGEITYAIRNTVFGDIEITQGDILAILEGNIIHTGKGIRDVTMQLLTTMVENEEAELITVFYGKDLDEEEAKTLQQEFNKKYPNVEFELYQGGQPLYHYIISAE
ncbi:MAG: hypothetical protein APF76_05155 [Desulfitibacter sp. BRH_c19]|nr:MAG: hypothetical protein APF76_05155 [Desulfitibacter sp. BRH_c19]